MEARRPESQFDLDQGHEWSYVSYVKKATISVAKNNLSRLIAAVKRGETVLIFDRDKPVARLEPVTLDPELGSSVLSDLVKRGLVAPPRHPLDVAAFLARRTPVLSSGASVVEALLEEREQGL